MIGPGRADVIRIVHNLPDDDLPEWQVSHQFRGETVVGESDCEIGAVRNLAERMEQIVGGDGR